MMIDNIIIVDGMTLPVPMSYSVTRNDLDSNGTQRSEDFVLHRDRRRAGMYTVEVSWELPVSRLEMLTEALAPEKIAVNFFDLTSGKRADAYMYAANPTASVLAPGSATDSMICTYSVSLIEY